MVLAAPLTILCRNGVKDLQDADATNPGVGGGLTVGSRARKRRRQVAKSGTSHAEVRVAGGAPPSHCYATELQAASETTALALPARVNDLIQANDAMRRGLARLASSGDIDALLEFFVIEALRIAAADAAALFTRGTDTELFCRAVAANGAMIPGWRDLEWVLRLPSVTARDSAGVLGRIFLEDSIFFHSLDDGALASWFPELAQWHLQRGNRLAWNLAIRVGHRVVGVLGLTFREPVKPSTAVRQILEALIQQVALALEVTRLESAARDAHLMHEREQAASEQIRSLTRANDALRASSDTLAASDSLGPFFETVVKQIIEHCDAAAGAINLPTEDEQFIEIIAPFERDANSRQIVPIMDIVNSMPLTGFVQNLWQEIKTTPDYRWQSLDQVGIPEDKRRHHEDRGHRHDAHIPIRLRGVTLGYVGLAFTSERKPSEARLQVVRVLAQQAALAIGMTRSMETARSAALLLERDRVVRNQIAQLTQANDALRATSDMLVATDSLEKFVELIVVQAMDICGAAAGAANLLAADEGSLEMLSPFERDGSSGRLIPITALNRTMPLMGLIKEIWEEIKTTPDYRWQELGLPEFSEDIRHYDEALGHKLVVGVPIRLRGVTFGQLTLAFGPQGKPPEAQLQVVRVLAQQAALAIEMRRLGEGARQVAIARAHEQAQQERVAELAKANQAMRVSSERLVAVDRLEDFLETVVRAAVEACGAVAGSIGVPHKDHGLLKILVTVDDSGPGEALMAVRISDHPIPVTSHTRQMWEGLRASDCWWSTPNQVGFPEQLRAYHAARGHRQIAHLPIRLRGETLGYLGLAFRCTEQPALSRLELSRVFVQQAALAIGMTRLADESRDAAVTRERELAGQQRLADLERANEAMRTCSEQLVALDNLQNFLDTVIRTSVVVCGAAGGSIGVINTHRTNIHIVALIDDSGADGALVVPAGIDRNVPVTLAVNAAWEQLEVTAGCYWVKADASLWPESLLHWHKRNQHRQVGYFPIRLHGATLGFLALSYRSEERPTEVQLAISRALAQQAALAIGMTMLADEARLAAVTRERTEQLDAANEAIRRSIERTAAEESVSSVLCSIVEEASRLVGAAGGLISSIQASEGSPFHPVAIWLQGRRMSVKEWMETSGVTAVGERSVEDPTGFFGRIRKGDELILRVDPTDPLWWPDALAFMLRIGAKQCLSLPVRSRGSVVGLLKLWLPHDEAPSPELLAHLRTFTHQAALSLELIHFREKTSKAATEAERARVAGEIHDGLAQAFTGILMQARAARISTRYHRRDTSPFLERIESLAAGGLEEARRSLFALRSISVEHDGLVAALERLVSNLSIDGRMRCNFVNRAPTLQAAPTVEDAIYRIVQEAAQNALKHADARQVDVTFELVGNELHVNIEDDGVGISTDVVQRARESGGLRAMRDRAKHCGGTLVVESRSPRGTRVAVVFPLAASGVRDGK
jgi:signal transduction histidine kinase